MDIIDHAQELDRKFQEEALKIHFVRRESINNVIPGLTRNPVCLDCDDEIPPARIEAKPDAVRCMDCQARKERK